MENSKTKQLKQKSINELKLKTRGTTQGAFTGAVAGAMFGYFKQKNVYVSALIGLAVGVAFSAVLIGNFSKELIQLNEKDEI